MSEFITADAMRGIEREAIDSGEVTGLALMERAGEAVVDAVFDTWPDLPHRAGAVVLCGPGNNGGDGFVVARLLIKRGWDVTVFFYGDAAKLSPDASHNHAAWQAMAAARTISMDFPDVSTTNAVDFAAMAYQTDTTRLVIDALFGIGLARPLHGLRPILECTRRYGESAKHRHPVYHVSIDVPSGLAEQGPVGTGPDVVFQADLTVTFHRKKQAHRHGMQYCGKLVVADIGL